MEEGKAGREGEEKVWGERKGVGGREEVRERVGGIKGRETRRVGETGEVRGRERERGRQRNQ